MVENSTSMPTFARTRANIFFKQMPSRISRDTSKYRSQSKKVRNIWNNIDTWFKKSWEMCLCAEQKFVKSLVGTLCQLKKPNFTNKSFVSHNKGKSWGTLDGIKQDLTKTLIWIINQAFADQELPWFASQKTLHKKHCFHWFYKVFWKLVLISKVSLKFVLS